MATAAVPSGLTTVETRREHAEGAAAALEAVEAGLEAAQQLNRRRTAAEAVRRDWRLTAQQRKSDRPAQERPLEARAQVAHIAISGHTAALCDE